MAFYKRGFEKPKRSNDCLQIRQPRSFSIKEGDSVVLVPLDWPPINWYMHKFKVYDNYLGDYKFAFSACSAAEGKKCAFCKYKKYGFSASYALSFSALVFQFKEDVEIDFELPAVDFIKENCKTMFKVLYNGNNDNIPQWESEDARRKGDLKYCAFNVQRLPVEGKKTSGSGNDISYIGRMSREDLISIIKHFASGWDWMKELEPDEKREKLKLFITPYNYEEVIPVLNYEDVIRGFNEDMIICYFHGMDRVVLRKEDLSLVNAVDSLDVDEDVSIDEEVSDDVMEDEVPF